MILPFRKKHGSGNGSIVKRAAIKHAELLERYQRKTIELAAAMLAIEEAIEVLDPTERMLMRLYYIDGLTWEEVSYEINYSWRQVHRIHRRALEKLQSIYKRATFSGGPFVNKTILIIS